MRQMLEFLPLLFVFAHGQLVPIRRELLTAPKEVVLTWVSAYSTTTKEGGIVGLISDNEAKGTQIAQVE
jgi:hypothetical protein